MFITINIINKIFKFPNCIISPRIIGGINKLRQNLLLQLSNIKAKIMGIILTAMGASFFLVPTSLNVKIGFSSMLIGILIIFMSTKKSIHQQISDIQLRGNIDAVKKIIEELNLRGNAIFLSKTENLTEERILIPPTNSDIIQIPNIDNGNVLLKGLDGKNLGISIPPSGLQLLNEIEKDDRFEKTNIEDIDEKLQILVGIDLIKSLALKKVQNCWELELEKPIFCPNDPTLCKQYPCPTCSAILTAITRSSNNQDHKLWIKDTKHNGKKITFYLYFIKRKLNGVKNC